MNLFKFDKTRKNYKNDSLYSYPPNLNKKKFTKIMLWTPSIFRFFIFCFLCCFINLLGLYISQLTSYSMFYLDTVGTALAGILAGVNGAIIVGLLTNIVGGYFIEAQDFALFGICNMAAGITWAILPRLCSKIFGENIFDPNIKHGYTKFLGSILSVGFIVGMIATITSYFVQSTLFELTISSDNIRMNGSIGKSVVSLNNIYLVGIFFKGLGQFIDINNANVFILVSSLLSNIPDKILSTSIAYMIVVGMFRMPNFSVQKGAISSNRINTSYKWNKPTLSIIVFLAYYVYLYNLSEIKFDFSKILFLFILSIIVIMILYLSRKYFIRSTDPYKRHKELNLYFARHNINNYPTFRKDAFEDSIKILTILFAVSQFAVSLSITKGDKPLILGKLASITEFSLVLDNMKLDLASLDMGILLVYNVLLLQSLRYFIAVFLRMLGRF